MKNSLLIAAREWKARVGSRAFVLVSILGPLLILGLTYLLFAFGGEGKQNWNVLVADPYGILDNRMLFNEKGNISYSFADGYVELEDFRDGKAYQKFDAVVEVNEKVLANKVSHVFYRSSSQRMQTVVRYHVERRLEEVMVQEHTDFTIQDYRKIKQPLTMKFTDVYDPHNESSDLSVWVGFFFGALIFIFIFLFGMTILRGVTREKSNRIVEVMLASVSPNQLMMGKIVGIGLSAIFQFLIWILIIGVGLYFMREMVFQDMLDAANLNIQEMSAAANNISYEEQYFTAVEYNEFVNLVYERVKFGVMIPFFVIFFIAGYLFYGAFFAAIGASMGTESDGQQFVIPIIFLLLLSLYSGYYVLQYPEGNLSTLLHYLPFTAPVVVMVKLGQGYEPGHDYEIYLSMFVLLVSAFLMLIVAARLYKNGILQFGHRVRLRHVLKWLRKT